MTTKKALKGDKKLQVQVDFLERLQAHLEEGKSARGFDFTEDELSWIHDMPLLSAKPVIYAANMSEEDFRNGVDKNEHYQEVKAIAEAEHAAVLPICAKIEEDIADMEADDKAMFLEDLGLEESGLNRIIREGYSLLGLISYLTAGKQEVRAAIPHKERLATLHAICLQISLQSLFRIFPHASCVHIFRDISGKYSKIHKGFSPFFPSSLKKSDDAICIRQIRNRLSYFTKMLVNTSSIHSAFCFI